MRKILIVAAVLALCLVTLAGTTPTTAQSGNTWRVDFYSNPDWAGNPVTTEYTTYISYNWGYGSPSPYVPVDNFTARMTTDAFFYAGLYNFTITADDEATLTVDGVTYLDTRGTGSSGKTFNFQINMWQGTHHVEVLYREYTELAYIYVSWAFGGGQPVPPPAPPPPPPPAGNCAPVSASSVSTQYGDYTPCIQQGLHQSACFVSDGQWNSPNMGSIETEPQIEVWGNCTEGTVTTFPVSCDPNVPRKEYRCSKTFAGWFPN